jgi:hypothetical protein
MKTGLLIGTGLFAVNTSNPLGRVVRLGTVLPLLHIPLGYGLRICRRE